MTTKTEDQLSYLKGLQAVRERSRLVLEAANQGALNNFDYYPERLSNVADKVSSIIERDFGPDRFNEIPPHGRWQHFEVGGIPRVSQLIGEWENQNCDKLEITRRLIDLFLVSVLLDAGAGDTWRYVEPTTGGKYERSEGIAVASLYMFKAGAFSEDKEQPECVQGSGLCKLNVESFEKHFQVTPDNEIIGCATRVALLNSVGESLLRLPSIFGKEGRPGNLVDYLIKEKGESDSIDYETLWSILQQLLLPAWPKDRTNINGTPIGDAWPLKVLEDRAKRSGQLTVEATIQPFHKLTQWLAYSLAVPFDRILSYKWKNMSLGTGLPEYRNGGLFVDMKVLQLKDSVLKQGLEASTTDLPKFSDKGDVVVEWRAMTVALLDELYSMITTRFSERGINLSMAQMLEAGTWKGGRELAAECRPLTRSSPILLDGDGTLF